MEEEGWCHDSTSTSSITTTLNLYLSQFKKVDSAKESMQHPKEQLTNAQARIPVKLQETVTLMGYPLHCLPGIATHTSFNYILFFF